MYVFSIKYRYSDILLKKKTSFTRYRTLTIYNVFFEQNKMAEGGIRNTTPGDSVGVSCVYPHKGPSWIHV